MPHRIADTPLFPLSVVLQILPQAWPRLRRQGRHADHHAMDSWATCPDTDTFMRMDRLMRAIEATRSSSNGTRGRL
ncbi:MAG TPA: hypothetical protein VN809_09860 [Telmatospirillum sp.]|nr:hypothetical protein [Telmatospirillum sp.]